jgi:hypothetical protein
MAVVQYHRQACAAGGGRAGRADRRGAGATDTETDL